MTDRRPVMITEPTALAADPTTQPTTDSTEAPAETSTEGSTSVRESGLTAAGSSGVAPWRMTPSAPRSSVVEGGTENVGHELRRQVGAVTVNPTQ